MWPQGGSESTQKESQPLVQSALEASKRSILTFILQISPKVEGMRWSVVSAPDWQSGLRATTTIPQLSDPREAIYPCGPCFLPRKGSFSNGLDGAWKQ